MKRKRKRQKEKRRKKRIRALMKAFCYRHTMPWRGWRSLCTRSETLVHLSRAHTCFTAPQTQMCIIIEFICRRPCGEIKRMTSAHLTRAECSQLLLHEHATVHQYGRHPCQTRRPSTGSSSLSSQSCIESLPYAKKQELKAILCNMCCNAEPYKSAQFALSPFCFNGSFLPLLSPPLGKKSKLSVSKSKHSARSNQCHSLSALRCRVLRNTCSKILKRTS